MVVLVLVLAVVAQAVSVLLKHRLSVLSQLLLLLLTLADVQLLLQSLLAARLVAQVAASSVVAV
jgi:hypothetical protein